MSQTGILVIRGGAIGDFILTLPVLAALRSQFPGIRLEVLGYPHIAQLAVAGGLADAARSIEASALAGFFARDGTLNPSLQAYFASFAIVFSYLYDPDGVFQANVARCSKATFFAGPHRPDDAGAIHATRIFLKPLERLAIFDADPVPRLKLALQSHLPSPASAQEPWLRTESFTIAVHPGSGSERKNWPEARWFELLHLLLAATSCDLLLVGGEAEGARLERLAERLPSGRIQVARSLPLAALASELTHCRAFVGHDSGISHLAAALGVPSLILWAHTAEAVWRPLGPSISILRHTEGLSSLPASAVLAQLLALLHAVSAPT